MNTRYSMATSTIEGVDGKRAKGASNIGLVEILIAVSVGFVTILCGVVGFIVITLCKILEKLLNKVFKP